MINYTANNFRGGRNMYSNILGLLIVVIAVVSISEAAFSQDCPNPPDKVYLLRHAEKEENSGITDKLIPLTCPRGHEMSKDLIKKIKSLEERASENDQVSAIYTSEFLRTRQTALPLAVSKNLDPKVIKKNNINTLVTKICNDHSGKTILVVGHSDKIPTILKDLCQNTNSPKCLKYSTKKEKGKRKVDYCHLYVFDFDQSTGTFREDAYCEYP